MPKPQPVTASEEQVTEFIKGSEMTKVDLEPLMGLAASSKGKTLTRWETYGATPMGTLLMAYMARYGFDLAREVAETGRVDLSVSTDVSA